MKPFAINESPIHNNSTHNYNTLPSSGTRRGSGATLDDASSIADQASKIDSPRSNRSHSSAKGSQGDLNNDPASEASTTKSLATLTITPRESIYVRALFRYDPSIDRALPARGLPFEHGDILYVVNANDPEWWQARYRFPIDPPKWELSKSNSTFVPNNCNSNNLSNAASSLPPTPNMSATRRRLGIIPSQRRTERRNRILAKRVKFTERNVIIGNHHHNNTLSHPFQQLAPATSVSNSERSTNPCVCGSTVPSTRYLDSGSADSLLSPTAPLGPPPYTNGDSVSIGGTIDRKKKHGTFSIFKRFSNRRNKIDRDENMVKKSASFEDVQDSYMQMSRTYEIVQPLTLKMARPLVLFGPFKDRIAEALLESDHGFAPCIQHTSRPPMPGERDGVDFHFVPSKAVMQADIAAGKFLDVVIHSNHFYAISLQSVLDVLQRGRMCILDVTIKTIFRLQAASLYPISILVKPENVMQWPGMQRRLTMDHARRMYETCLQIESEYWYMLTAVLNLDSFDNVLAGVQRVLVQHRGPKVWVSLAAQSIQSSSIPISNSIDRSQPFS